MSKVDSVFLKNRNPFDRFRGRVMFPIHSLSGRVLGFGGRTLKNDKKTAKYINSPESLIYHKSKVLYGLFFAKSAIVKEDCCFLVEGYTDVISMHQIGVENVVASSGTALSVDQIKLISRYTKNIHILFDGDAVGIKALFRGIDLILAEGMNVKVVLFLPDGEDPDSYAKKVSRETLKVLLMTKPKIFYPLKTQLLQDECNNDPSKKAELIKEIVRSIAIIPDHITRAVYIKNCSKILQIAESILTQEVARLKRQRNTTSKTNEYHPQQKVKAPSQKRVDFNQSYHQEWEIIRFLLCYGDKEVVFFEEVEEISEAGNKKIREEECKMLVATFIVQEIADEIQFNNAIHAEILAEYVSCVNNQQLPSASFLCKIQQSRH